MDDDDFDLLCERKLRLKIQFKNLLKIVAEKLAASEILEEVTQIQAENMEENLNNSEIASNPVETILVDKYSTSQKWPDIFVFPKNKVSFSLEAILSQPDKIIGEKGFKNYSIFNELIGIVFQEILALNM